MLKTRIQGFVTAAMGGNNRFVIVQSEDGLKHTIHNYNENIQRYRVGDFIDVEVELKQFESKVRFYTIKGYKLSFIEHDE